MIVQMREADNEPCIMYIQSLQNRYEKGVSSHSFIDAMGLYKELII